MSQCMWTFPFGGWRKKFCSVYYDSRFIKGKRSWSKRKNLEWNQRFGRGEVLSPWHGWTQHNLECTWLDKWPPSCHLVSKNIGHSFLFIAYSSWCLPNLNGQTWMGYWQDTKVLCKIFDESPACRNVYLCEETSEVFPMKCGSTRWIEDQPNADWHEKFGPL